METPDQTLRQIACDQSAVRHPALPRWFFAVMAAIAAALCLAQTLAPSGARNSTFTLAVVAVVLGSRHWLWRPGVRLPSVPLREIGPFLAALLGIVVACLTVTALTAAWWAWIAGAVLAAAVVLGTGRRYTRAFGHAA